MSSSSRALLLGVLASALLAACAPGAQQPSEGARVPQISDAELRDRAKQNLSQGIDQYGAGKYPEATRNLRASLEYGQLTRLEQGNAHKYLAFILCVSGRESECRDEFRRALEVDPNFDLTAAEAGHPIWGPVYRDVRAQLAATAAPVPAKPAPRAGAEGLLDQGVAKYNEGSYDAAAKLLDGAFKKGLTAKADQIAALKYSAFSSCLLGHHVSCRNEFMKIFRVDADFDLAPAEAGHPAWSKTFAEARQRAKAPPKKK
jgi:tetratricopeptide (TPR) repeat protein